jgi:hypothetical protein
VPYEYIYIADLCEGCECFSCIEDNTIFVLLYLPVI